MPATTIVFGPQAFLREYIVAGLSSRLSEQGYKYRSFQIGAGADFTGVLDELRALDLFAPKRLIACRILKSHRDRGGDDAAEEEGGSPRAASPGGESALALAIEAGADPSRLLLVYERDTVPARIRKAAERTAAMVNCMRPFDNQLPDYVSILARSRGLKLAAGTADFLAGKHAGDLSAVLNALDKAALTAEGNKAIGPDDFGEPGGRKMPDVFEIADSIGRGRSVGVLGQIDRAIEMGRDPVEILVLEIIPVLRRMMIAAAMLARRSGSGEIAAAIGASPMSGLVTRAIDGARRFGLERLRLAYARATEMDESFKNGEIKAREQH